ncbi:MAG: hypothetical protein AB7S44_03065 [Spirochaetales bacterium]
MDTKEFFNSILIEEAEIEKANHYIETKGLYIHVAIRDMLLSRGIQKPSYKQIATVYRYDKRIRKILYEHIAYLEEFFRAYILNQYGNNVKQSFWIKRVNPNNLKNSLELLKFGELLSQVKKLPNKEKVLIITSHFTKNIEALIELRNAVFHNKFLLVYLGFKKCFIDEEKSGFSFRANLINLSNFLPQEVKKQFLKEIENSQYQKHEKPINNKTDWKLPSEVVIKLKD